MVHHRLCGLLRGVKEESGWLEQTFTAPVNLCVLLGGNDRIPGLRCFVNVTFNPSQWIKRRQHFSQIDLGCWWRGCSGTPSYCWELRHLASQVSPSKGTSKALNPNYLDFTFLASSLAGRKGGFSFCCQTSPKYSKALESSWHESQCSFDFIVHTVAALGGCLCFSLLFLSICSKYNSASLPGKEKTGRGSGVLFRKS